MGPVEGVDFGAQWNAVVFWLTKHLQSKYGPVCVYRPNGMNELRAAYYPPARKAPWFVKTADEGYGVFLLLRPRAKNAPPVAIRPKLASSGKKQMSINNRGLVKVIDNWFTDVRKKLKLKL